MHIILVVLIVLALAMVAGIYLMCRRMQWGWFASLIAALFASPVLVYGAVSSIQDCSASYALRMELQKTLTAAEFDARQASRLVCPLSYHYQRAGKGESAMAAPGLFGDQIYYATDEHSP